LKSVVVPISGFELIITTFAKARGALEALSITIPRIVCVGCCEYDFTEADNTSIEIKM
jgi:hypothetical protein